MSFWKSCFQCILFPHPVLLFLLTPISVVLLIHSFLVCAPTDPISLLAYTLSFYVLLTVCLCIPNLINFFLRFKKNNKYVIRYTSDVHLRVNLSLFRGFFFSASYAVFQLVLGIYHASVWFYSMACYYLLLAVMRLLLVRHTRSYAPGQSQELEWKKYRFCGICLLIMNCAVAIIIFYIVWQNRTFRHHEITTIAMAAYTFTSLTLAIINVIRYRKYKSPVYSASKIISLAAAAVSMLTLETAMITVFGAGESELFRRIMLSCTGAAVVFVIQGLAIYMIRNASQNLRTSASNTP